MTDAAAKRRRRRQQQRPTEEEEEGSKSVGGTGMSKPLSPTTTTTTGVDIVPNGIAFNVAKRWLKVDASSNSHSSNNVISLEAFLNASKREEREEKPRSQRLGLGAKSLPLESLENDADDIGKENYRPNGTREETRGGEKAGFEESDGKFFRERRRRRRRRERPEQE